jgi:hypothetical protein
MDKEGYVVPRKDYRVSTYGSKDRKNRRGDWYLYPDCSLPTLKDRADVKAYFGNFKRGDDFFFSSFSLIVQHMHNHNMHCSAKHPKVRVTTP